MSEVRLVIRDAQRDINDTRHGGFADRVVAALSAEPETIEELEAALVRFEAPDDYGFLRGFSKGINDEPYDAGLVVVDLAARLVVCDSTYSYAGRDGYVSYHNGKCASEVAVRYHLSEDWKFSSEAIDWEVQAKHRRTERSNVPVLDTRAVLYGKPLLEFIAGECLATFRGPASAAPARPANDESASPLDDDQRDYDAVKQIHAKWLTTPRDDLGGQSPRDVLLARHSFIDWDLQDRAEQWSQLGQCPRGLDPESAAFRFAGFGTHELVTYYELVRDLLWSCCDAVQKLPPPTASVGLTAGDVLTDEVPRLARLREEWLAAPDPEFHGRTPRSIIYNERARLPEGVTGKEAIIDHDCPLCQMQADLPGPMFWHLDGCNMDQDFAFSFHRTREEWDEEERRHEEFDRRFNAEQAERERLGVKYPRGGYGDPDYVWDRSFSAPDSHNDTAFIRLFSIGSHLAELIAELKEPSRDRELPAENRDQIDRLSRDFGNLREVCQSGDFATMDSLFEPVLDRFRESLDALAGVQPELEPKCADLQQRLGRFLEPPRESDDSNADDSAGANDEDALPF
jgi:hypothetical protein